MTKIDLVAGAKHSWLLDRAEVLAFLTYQAVLAAVTVIAGGPIWLLWVYLAAGFVPAFVRWVQRSAQAAEARDFYEWMTKLDGWDEDDELATC